MLIIYRSLIILPLLMTTTFSKDQNISSRKPQVLFQGKHGHRRNVGKIQALIPLVSKMDYLWFLDLRFLKDSHTNKEGNFGLGYRYQGHDSIFGFYGFFDRRRSLLNNMYNQFTIGCERLTEKSDVRFNAYFPQEKIFQTHTHHHDSIITTLETPLKGIDFEMGSSVPFLESLKVYAGGFAFKGKEKVPSFAGYSARMQWKWNDYVSMETSYRNDYVRRNHMYVGVSLQIPIGHALNKKKVDKKNHSLEKRMVDFPIRDEDIVAVVSQYVKMNPYIEKMESLSEDNYDQAFVHKEKQKKKKPLIFLAQDHSEPMHIQPPLAFEKEYQVYQEEKDVPEIGSFTFEEEFFEVPQKKEPSVLSPFEDQQEQTVHHKSFGSEYHDASPMDEILHILQNAVEKQGYSSESLYTYFQDLLNYSGVDENDLQEQKKWLLEKKQIEHEIEMSRIDELNQARVKPLQPQGRSTRRGKSLDLENFFKSRMKESAPLKQKAKPPLNLQEEREKLERETELFLKKSEEKRMRLEEEFNHAFENSIPAESDDLKAKETLKQKEEYALIFAQKEKMGLIKGLNSLKQGQILFDEKAALKSKIEESFTTLEQELSALKRPSIRRYEFLHLLKSWKYQIDQKIALPSVVVEKRHEKGETFNQSLFENIVHAMLLKGETKSSMVLHLKNVPLQAEDEESRKWRLEHETILEEMQKSKEIEEKENAEKSKNKQKRPNRLNMSQFGSLMLRGKKEEDPSKQERRANKTKIDISEKLQKIKEEALLAEQRNLREIEENERQAQIKREKAENQFRGAFVKFQSYFQPPEFLSSTMTLTQMEERMRKDVERASYDLLRRLNQLSYGQILFDQRSQMRDDLQKLSDSLFQEIHPIFLKRPTHKRFDFVNQYENFVCQISDAESRERKELMQD